MKYCILEIVFIISITLLFSCSVNRDNARVFKDPLNLNVVINDRSLYRDSTDNHCIPNVSKNENFIVYKCNSDTILLNKGLEKFSVLFSSGLVADYLLPNNNLTFHVHKIEELTKMSKKTKKHRFKLSYSISQRNHGNYRKYIGVTGVYFEIKSQKAYKDQQYAKHIDDSEIVFWLEKTE